MQRRKRLTFWGADEDDDSLARAVMAGEKTVTVDTVQDYFKPYGEYGDGDDVIEVYDGRRRLRCPIRATKVETIRFGAIPDAVWRGEGFASADEFRRVHVDCLPQYALHAGFEFVALHFQLLEIAER